MSGGITGAAPMSPLLLQSKHTVLLWKEPKFFRCCTWGHLVKITPNAGSSSCHRTTGGTAPDARLTDCVSPVHPGPRWGRTRPHPEQC